MANDKKKKDDTPAEVTTEAGVPAWAEEVSALRSAVDDLIERVLELETSVAQMAAENATLRADVALSLTTVDRVRREAAKGVISTETTLSLAEFRAVREAGRRRFVAAADCRHHRLTINKGADLDLRDYDVRELDALVGEGILRLSAVPMG